MKQFQMKYSNRTTPNLTEHFPNHPTVLKLKFYVSISTPSIPLPFSVRDHRTYNAYAA